MKKLLCSLAAAVAVGFSASAKADYVLTTADNVIFTINVVSSTELTLNIANAMSAGGTWANASGIVGIAFKDIGTFTSAVLTPPIPPALGTPGVTNELNANGCTGGSSGGWCFGKPTISLAGDSPSTGITGAQPFDDNMTFTVDFTGGILAISALGPHLKVDFSDMTQTKGDWNKVGNLLSSYIPVREDGCTVNCNPEVPEPASFALVGLALFAAGFARRRA